MPSTITEQIREQVSRRPDKIAYRFVTSGVNGLAETTATYWQLDERARRVAVRLRQEVAHQDRVLLLYPAGLPYVEAFLGCLYSGTVAVTVPLPLGGSALDNVERIARDTDARLVLTVGAEAERLRQEAEASEALSGVGIVATDEDLPADPDQWGMPPITAGSTAFLQYTSGSTSEPKGVVVNQGSILANLRELSAIYGDAEDAVTVGWLPHYHDMGLIAMLLHPVSTGGECVFMAPTTFLRRPLVWLRAITRWRGTITFAPDFSYEFCARIIRDEDMADLDLSSLRWTVTGAEPVRRSTVERFSERFAPAGFDPGSFAPGYGLAESTLVVTIAGVETPPVFYRADPGALHKDEILPAVDGPGMDLAACGPMGDHMRVVDPNRGVALDPGQVGELWVRGPSVAQGYWQRPEATEKTFGAHLADGEGPFLRTGDLGAEVDGQFYVTGRSKDLLIVHGRNLYPHDLEHTSKGLHPAVEGRTAAACMLSETDGGLVLVQEVTRNRLGEQGPDALARQIQTALVEAFEVPHPGIVLVQRGAVPTTTSGKVQRSLSREMLLEERFTVLHERIPAAVGRVLEQLRRSRTEDGADGFAGASQH